jgi:RNA polymerase sigma factor for flagellar operon FliA
VSAVDPAEHLGLVHYLARRVHRRVAGAAGATLAFDDLLQAGYLGLVEATRGFAEAHGVAFVAYARPRIEGAMLDLLRGADPVSRGERRARRDLLAHEAALTARLGRPPTDAELAEAAGTAAAEIARLRAPEPEATELDEATLAAAGAPTAAGAPELDATRAELGRAVADCLERLTPPSRLVVVARVLDELTLEALGRLLSSSKDRVWRLEQGARRALRTCLEGKGWEPGDAIAAARGS